MTEHAVALPHFWALIDALPIPVLYKEQAKKTVFVNQAALSLFALPDSEHSLLLSDIQKLPVHCPDSNEPYPLLHNPLLMALSGSELNQAVNIAGNTMLLQSKAVSLSFTLHASMLLSFTPCPSSNVTIALPKESSQHQLSELEEALAFDKLISLISTELINVDDNKLDQHIDDALRALGEFCHADRSYIFRFNTDISLMSNTHEWVREGIKPQMHNLQDIPREGLPYFYQIMQRDLVFAVDKVSELPEAASAEKQEFDAEDIQSVLCCAMQSDDTLLGFVGCDMVSRQRSWTGNDMRRMKLVGDMLANALQSVSYRQSLQHISSQLQHANTLLQQQANQDGLTGIANRRHFDQHLQQELHRANRHQQPLSLLMLDIDCFKAYNDHYGHQAGDSALKQVAQLLQQLCRREGELAARYGGEEFAMILPGTSEQECMQIAKHIQHALEQKAIVHEKSSVCNLLTLSLGCHTFSCKATSSCEQLIAAADKALYRAKAEGRNQIRRYKMPDC